MDYGSLSSKKITYRQQKVVEALKKPFCLAIDILERMYIIRF